MIALQHSAGNRATARAVATGGGLGQQRRWLRRLVKEAGSPGSRPDLAPGDTGSAVTLLQSRLARFMTSEFVKTMFHDEDGNATVDAPPVNTTGTYDTETYAAVALLKRAYALKGTGVDAAVWVVLDELDALQNDAIPTTRSFEDLSDAHKAAVVTVVNRHLDMAYDNFNTHRGSFGARTVRDHLVTARQTVSVVRNQGGNYSLNITLRDAQRYLYGRLAPYTDGVELKRWSGAGEFTATMDQVFKNDPSDANVKATIMATEEYENLKASGTDVRTSGHPASALGGIPFFNKGIADAKRDTQGNVWTSDARPGHMDTTNIGEHCVAQGEGAFPNCGGSSGSEEA